MKNNLFEVIVGTFVLACAVYFFFFSFNKSGISTSATYQISAIFNSIDGVSSGSDVKIAGVKIGSIAGEKIDPITYRAILSLDINKNIKIPSDSSAKILSSGLLGGKYVGIEIGAEEEMLEEGGKIQFTQSGVNFEELLGKFIFSSKKD
ncbi:MAG: phospholipid/cholesterol/gamma-HCH transport system substrate-binding protein [Rickettsiales bacterium]|jgi:phospholipid/cholesterol/gamma-HCH transport system substrate-binding protein